ncbi:mannosyl-glycoprotein endo-beta-N-acetylglucosamidase, partial [Neobacillus bataviensis LMG 21833]
MVKTVLTQGIIKTEGSSWISSNVIKKAILPSFCFAVLSTTAFEEVIHAAGTNSPPANINSQLPITTKYVNVSSGSLNLRGSASTSGAVIASLSKGTSVTVYS